ncbi:hypothetical protein L596_018188 [Steinernema carpocapsae]|uniref:Major facilitator superfamily (MFS) profile domain-containing protein n=1 Tax=Steinernema carpocapsae TaxID=34508 RepID=A0A4U5N487_STECR|nr:hypothetical protein L596_018188 [Steinernema carpocapsae]
MDPPPPPPQKQQSVDQSIVIFGTRTRFFMIALVLMSLSAVWSNILTFNFAVICMHPHRRLNGTYMSLANIEESPGHNPEDPHVISFFGEQIIWYNSNETSMLVAIVAVGALLANLGSGVLINHFGIRSIFGLLGILSSVATILIPTAARLGLPYFLFVRFLQGVAFSGNFAVIGSFTDRWTYHKQNGMFVSTLVAHLQLSQAITMPVSSVLCTSFGWPSVYYFHGIVSLFIFTVFVFVYRNNPGKHPMVGDVEMKKIAHGKEQISKAEQRSIPYSSILKSWPVWAVWVASLGCVCTVNLMALFAPTYLHTVLGFEVKHTGISAAIPPLLQFLIKVSCGIISDKLKNIPETKKMKCFNTVSFVGSALCLAILGFMNTDLQLICLALIAGSTGFLGLTTGGFFKATPLIARHYSSFVMGNISFTFTSSMLLIPVLVSYLVVENTPEEWRNVFLSIALILLVTNAFFVIFGSSSPQPWTISQSRMQSANDMTAVKKPGSHGGNKIHCAS